MPSNSGVLPLESMLQLVHDARYDTSVVMAELHKNNLDGWSRKQSMFVPWKQEEVDLFELGMTCSPKLFDQLATIVKTRSVAECVVFYFGWKHTPRYKAWLQHMESLEEDEPSAYSRQLPNRKRKRESDVPMDPSERLYLEAMGSLELADNTSLLNIMLEAPNYLAEDLPSSPRDDEVTTIGDLSETTEMAESPSSSLLTSPLLASMSPSAAPVAPEPRSAFSIDLPRVLAAASPKRPKLEEPDDPSLIHAIDLHNSSTTIDPSALYASQILIPPEPSIDFFMHF